MKKAKEQTFWILWNPDYPAPPTARFATLKSAENSAAHMAEQYYPHRFYICQAGSAVRALPRKIAVVTLNPRVKSK